MLNPNRWAGLLLAGAALLAGCGGDASAPVPGPALPPTPVPDPDPPALTAWALQRATDSSLTAWLREALGPESKNYLRSVWATDVAFATAATAPAAGASEAGAAAVFSGTTLQETGVDEADRIKSDGTFVFDISTGSTGAGTLRRQRLDGTAVAATMLPAGTLTLPFAARTAFSRTGPSCLQGPHHGAQKSIMTGWRFDSSRTSFTNVCVVVSLMRSAPAFGAAPLVSNIVTFSPRIAFALEMRAAAGGSDRANLGIVPLTPYGVFRE